MGKGKGGKSAFDRFLEESYFAFWFRQWAAFFIVIGVILIIVGAVVGSLYPKSKQTSFAESQLVTSSESAQYSSWSSKVETVSYEFLAVDPSNLTCSLRGPFVFDVTNAKTSVVFENGGSTISYQLTKSKTFRAAESSKDLSPIITLNPSYLHLTKVNGSGQEFPFLLSAYQSSTIDSTLEAFFRSTAPILIGARGIAQVFPDSIKTVRQDTIYPAYFGSLNQSLVNYQFSYLNDKVSKNPCSQCVQSGNAIQTGIFLSTFGAWSSNPNCRINPNAGLNLEEFYTLITTGFAGLANGACKTYLAAHSFNGSTWSGAGTVAYSILESLRNLDGLNSWYNPTNPATLGNCSTANRDSAAAHFNASRPQIDDVCDRFIKIFYSEVTPASITAPQELGARYFCVGPAASDAPIVYPSLPTEFTFSGLPLASMTAATYSYSTCLRHIAVLGDVTNFVIPAYESATIPPTYTASLTAQEYATLRAYLLSLDGNFKRWFVSLWRGDSGPYSCPTCIIRPLGQLANKNVFDNSSFAALVPMLFPELNPSQLRSYYALTNPNPKPDLLNPTLFSNITQATGILSRILKLEQATVRGQYGITQAQLDEIEKYASAMLAVYNLKLMDDNGLVGSNSEPLGLFQFARAHLACGPSRLTERCSIGAEFFGLTSPAAEFAFASYNPSPTPRYYKSFDNSDSTLRDTVVVQDMSSLFSFLGNKDETHLLQSTDADPNYQAYRKYFYYLLSTAVRSEAVASSSGALASRSPVEWISGFDDPTVPLLGSTPAFFGFDPNGAGSKLQIKSGTPDISQAYDLISIDGSSTLNAYPTPIDITKLKNPDAFAPGQISVGDEVKVLDVALSRPFTYTFSNPDENSKIQGVSTNKGTVSSSEWVVNPAYDIVIANLMPIPFAPISRFYSPCSAEFSHACKFPAIEDNKDDLFPKDFAIYSDLKTGLVVRSEGCVIMSLQVEAPNGVTQPFPITGYGITAATLFSQVRRRSFTQIPAEQADSYLKQFDDVSNTATAILLALIIVGALFVLTGAVFIVFWVIRHSRKSHAKSELDLVEDPFGEKSKNVASFKY